MLGDRGVAEEIEGGQIEGKLHFLKFFFVLGGLLFFAATVKILGFIISSTVMFTSIVYALNNKKSKWYVVLAVALALSFVVYVGFNYGLQIKLPWGINLNFGTDEVVVEEDW